MLTATTATSVLFFWHTTSGTFSTQVWRCSRGAKSAAGKGNTSEVTSNSLYCPLVEGCVTDQKTPPTLTHSSLEPELELQHEFIWLFLGAGCRQYQTMNFYSSHVHLNFATFTFSGVTFDHGVPWHSYCSRGLLSTSCSCCIDSETRGFNTVWNVVIDSWTLSVIGWVGHVGGTHQRQNVIRGSLWGGFRRHLRGHLVLASVFSDFTLKR